MRWLRPRIVHSHSKPKAHPSNPTPRDCQAQILMGKNYISNERKVYELGSIFTRACHRLCDLHAEDTQWAETKRRWVKKNWRSRVTKCHKHLWGFQMPLKGYSTWWPWLIIITCPIYNTMILLVYKRVYDGMMEAFLMLSPTDSWRLSGFVAQPSNTGNWIVKMNLCSIHSIGLSNSRNWFMISV
jgi:hypothetical protein